MTRNISGLPKPVMTVDQLVLGHLGLQFWMGHVSSGHCL